MVYMQHLTKDAMQFMTDANFFSELEVLLYWKLIDEYFMSFPNIMWKKLWHFELFIEFGEEFPIITEGLDLEEINQNIYFINSL